MLSKLCENFNDLFLLDTQFYSLPLSLPCKYSSTPVSSYLTSKNIMTLKYKSVLLKVI